MRSLWIVPLLVAIGGCASTISVPDDGRYMGFYAQGFEVDGFRPCGSDESWWVTEGAELRTRYRELTTRQYEEVYVELRGQVGPRGRYGHLGAYTRELSVDEVITIRPIHPGDCD